MKMNKVKLSDFNFSQNDINKFVNSSLDVKDDSILFIDQETSHVRFLSNFHIATGKTADPLVDKQKNRSTWLVALRLVD